MSEYYKQIPGENMFDYEDYYSSIAEWLPDNSRICEVGCADGRSAIFLAEKIHALKKNFTFYMVDNMDYGRTDQMLTLYTHIFRSGFYDKIELVPKDSLAASCKFPDQFLNFCFLDSSHKYEETKAEIMLWSKKIKYGGILAGHDYFSEENSGVGAAVEELIHPENIESRPTTNGYGVWSVNIPIILR